MARQFVYEPLESTAIRLLRITSVIPRITYSFETFSDIDVPRYEAISYCWGRHPATEKIFCDDQSSSYSYVTPNVLVLLKRLWTLEQSSGRFWIDALCINQADDPEKAQQVMRMGGIFAKARKVLIWLGSAENDSDLAMMSIEDLVKCLSLTSSEAQRLRFWPDIDELIKCCGLPAKDHPLWEALYNLFERPWFRRLWVIQEVVLAREVIILCGDLVLPWSIVVNFVIHMFDRFKDLKRKIMDSEHECRGLKAAGDFILAKDTRNLEWPQLLLITLSADREVAEPIDRIYGYLGLMDPKLRAQMSIDYSEQSRRQYWKIYVRAGKLIVKEYRGLFLLSAAKPEERLPELPSWCPDFGSSNVRGLGFVLKGFQAGIEEQIHLRSLTISTSPSSDAIQISGFRAGIVKSTVTRRYDKPHTWLESDVSCFACTQATYEHQGLSSNDIMEVHARTLVADDEDLAKYNLLELYNIIKYMLSQLQSPEGHTILWEDDSRRSKFFDYFERVGKYRHHAFFSTQNGRIGLGPPGIKHGDVICTLYGGEPVFVLRFPENNPKGPATLIGDAYVDGLMHLKEVPLEQRGEDEIFTIE